MTQSVFDHAAKWVSQRQTNLSQPSVSEAVIAETIAALEGVAGKCLAAVMLPDLFPGSRLETIYIPASDSDGLTTSSVHALSGGARIATSALSAIGAALTTELTGSSNDMARYEFDNGAQVFAYFPEARDAVLQATGLVILND